MTAGSSRCSVHGDGISVLDWIEAVLSVLPCGERVTKWSGASTVSRKTTEWASGISKQSEKAIQAQAGIVDGKDEVVVCSAERGEGSDGQSKCPRHKMVEKREDGRREAMMRVFVKEQRE